MEDNIIECGEKLPGLIGACFLNPTQLQYQCATMEESLKQTTFKSTSKMTD